MNTILTGNEIQTAVYSSQGKKIKVHADSDWSDFRKRKLS